MEHLAVVRVLQREAELDEPVEHLRLGERRPPRRLRLDPLREVAAVGKVHHDAQPPVLDEVLAHADDVRVAAQLHQHDALVVRLVLLLLVHVVEREPLHHVHPRVGVRPHQPRRAERAAADHAVDRVLAAARALARRAARPRERRHGLRHGAKFARARLASELDAATRTSCSALCQLRSLDSGAPPANSRPTLPRVRSPLLRIEASS